MQRSITDIEGVIAVIRAPRAQDAVLLGRALATAGVAGVEITFTVPKAAAAIAELVGDDAVRSSGTFIGAGTVRSLAQCESALSAGASFVVAPDLNPSVVELAHAGGALAIPGALTPSEVGRCVDAGADAVKIFPAAAMGGPGYVRTLSEPFPGTEWMVSGGIVPELAQEYREAGVRLLALGGALIDRAALACEDEAGLVAHASAALTRAAGAVPRR